MPSSLVFCSSIGIHHIQRSDECRILLIDHILVKFTPTEYRLLVPLLSGKAVADTDLVWEAFACDVSPQVCKNIDKHIDKIRSKLHLCGLNIHRVAKYGYLLLAASH